MKYGIVLIHPVYGRTFLANNFFKTRKEAMVYGNSRMIPGADMSFEVVKV